MNDASVPRTDAASEFAPPRHFRHHHLQSIYPSLPIRRRAVERRCAPLLAAARAEVVDCGDDVRLLAHVTTQERLGRAPADRLAVLLHGWEGSAQSLYLLSLGQTLVEDWATLSGSLWITLRITFIALAAAVFFGVTLAVLFTQSKWLEMALLPYAVILQVTPIVAIAPLIIIWVKDPFTALVLCATLAAIFPVIANTTIGLRSVDRALADLFQLYRASRWQTLLRLRVPGAAPYFFAGLRISAALALIGAVVAEFVAGTGGTESGLAYQILQAGLQLRIPRLFAALFMITAAGIALFALVSGVSWLALRRKGFTPEAREFGLEPPRGVLMLGVPGCGKSLCAKVIAADCAWTQFFGSLQSARGGRASQSGSPLSSRSA